MAFNYDLGNADAGIVRISKVRLEIGDTDDSGTNGVKPDGSNLDDSEIQYFLSENDDNVLLAAADACDVLARHWAKAVDISVGPVRESLGQAAARWAQEAARLRSKAGHGFRVTRIRKPQNIDAENVGEYTVGE